MNWQTITRPSAQARRYMGWWMFSLGIMMGILICVTVVQHRWGLSIWNFFMMLFDFFCAWGNFSLYNEWKEKQNKPLTK